MRLALSDGPTAVVMPDSVIANTLSGVLIQFIFIVALMSLLLILGHTTLKLIYTCILVQRLIYLAQGGRRRQLISIKYQIMPHRCKLSVLRLK